MCLQANLSGISMASKAKDCKPSSKAELLSMKERARETAKNAIYKEKSIARLLKNAGIEGVITYDNLYDLAYPVCISFMKKYTYIA